MTIRADNVTVRRGGRDLVHGASFTIPAGAITGVIGPNGAGKSTLLAVLSGDVRPQSGAAWFGDTPVLSLGPLELARRRAVMLQDVNIAFSFLVRDVVAMGRTPWSGTPHSLDDEATIDAALRIAQVEHLQDRDVMTLSGGERARTAFARVVAQRTPIVLLDEPTAAMDIAHQEHTMAVAKAMARTGTTVVMVVHDLQAAAAYCDYVVCLKQGNVVATGAVDEVLTQDILSQAYDWPIGVAPSAGGSLVISAQRGTVDAKNYDFKSLDPHHDWC
ncbi:heme ABC transporter ATP-binding protein [Corynebacterium cystitidis]|uniref:Iron complex transport system ATP-binding protein n=1 Tax=Corynebacterium cystitidis DSM 20524 TaxID=1121357 RepID=A0A1H9UWT6_9CORY|nr:heme ABC transporter ATP-binding protein [Corynebacterium cystitidis]WJY83684.1 Iron(3+)-hydroxamate import ATP-binding protein FhuC [Corynebacterium cystitidis DSM 20524]SES13517.1 iron complex transport system ATP-binding protein [Corynebacterium cystitidis DSM 20524]SNV91327.1 iron ABC transporter ATP-binding protein [Corynebacterium cystitidis]